MINYDAILNYAKLRTELEVSIKKEQYLAAANICHALDNIQTEIHSINLEEAEKELCRAIAIIKDIRGNRVAIADNSIKPADGAIYYHLIIEGNSYRFGAGRIGTTFDNSVYCSADEEDFIDSCCQILLNKGIIANIAEELNAVVRSAKKFIEYTKQANSSRVESSSRYRVADKGMKESCRD